MASPLLSHCCEHIPTKKQLKEMGRGYFLSQCKGAVHLSITAGKPCQHKWQESGYIASTAGKQRKSSPNIKVTFYNWGNLGSLPMK